MQTNSEVRTQVYPGGVDHPKYRLALRVWMFFFLLLICLGLLNYLGIVFK